MTTATLNETRPVEIALPAPGGELGQDEEWVVVQVGDDWRRIRLHDYAEVFSIPGLYERWVYDVFQCRSPAKIRELLERETAKAGVDLATLKALDLGAGNGYVAQELKTVGVDTFVGIDIYQEAADAAERDRPGLYDDYVVCDMTNLTPEARATLDTRDFNCLTCVAALGFGDIPPEVFAAAYNEIEDGGWVAFTIKSDFMDDDDDSGFHRMLRQLETDGVLEVLAREPYVHRVSTNGDKLMYIAFLGRKRADIPATWLA